MRMIIYLPANELLCRTRRRSDGEKKYILFEGKSKGILSIAQSAEVRLHAALPLQPSAQKALEF
jgi:hypothetical protein